MGAGFWAKFQLAAWQELADAKCVAIYDRDRTKALELARQFGVSEVPLDENGLFRLTGVDFVDIVTDVHSHVHLVSGCIRRANHEIRIYDKKGVTIEHVEIPKYGWANPAYELVHASIVACHQNLLSSLKGSAIAETTSQDNLRTLQLVYSAYQSAKERRTIEID